MIHFRQLVIVLSMTIFVALAIAATHVQKSRPRNLKVLPPDISNEMLDSIMHSYNKALNVNCAFCHAAEKSSLNYAPGKTTSNTINYESDENPMKEEARKMMRLTIGLNKEYFYYDSTKRPEYLNVVTCITCHRGDPIPADLK